MARIWFPFSSRLLNHPESVLIHRTTLSFPHLLPLASHRSRTQAPIDLVLRRCVPWLQEPEASSMEAGLQAALGSDDPASRSVEDGSQEATAAAMSGGFHSGHRSLLLLPTNDPTAAATPQARAGIRCGSTFSFPFPLFRFCLAQFACGLFFWPSLLLPAWPVMCVISSFFTAQIFGILEIGNIWGPQISSSPNHRQGQRWIFEICAFFPSPSSGLFVFPLISSGLFVSLSPSRVRVF